MPPHPHANRVLGCSLFSPGYHGQQPPKAMTAHQRAETGWGGGFLPQTRRPPRQPDRVFFSFRHCTPQRLWLDSRCWLLLLRQHSWSQWLRSTTRKATSTASTRWSSLSSVSVGFGGVCWCQRGKADNGRRRAGEARESLSRVWARALPVCIGVVGAIAVHGPLRPLHQTPCKFRMAWCCLPPPASRAALFSSAETRSCT